MHKKAVITGLGEPLSITTSQLEKPPAGHVRIRTAFAGVCHTDLAINEKDILDIRQHFGEDKFKGMILGHEISGYIDEVGDGISLDGTGLKMGDPVMVLHNRGCRSCRACQTGHPNVCPDLLCFSYGVGVGPVYPGGFQTHLNLPMECLKKVPNGMTMEVAAMMSCSIGTAYAAVLKLRSAVEFGIETNGKARIVIVGCGGLGLWAIKLLKKVFQNVTLIAVDVGEFKLEIAKKYGADQCILWNTDKSIESNVSLVTKEGLVHGVIDFCGNDMTLKSSLSLLLKNGVLVIVGVANSTLPVDFQDLVLRSITVCGVLNYTDKEIDELAELIVKHNLTSDNLEFVTLEDINEAFYKLKNGKIKVRSMIRF